MKKLIVLILLMALMALICGFGGNDFKTEILNLPIKIGEKQILLKDLLKNKRIINLAINADQKKETNISSGKDSLTISFTILGKNIYGLEPLYYNSVKVNAVVLFQQMIMGNEIVDADCKGILNIYYKGQDIRRECKCMSLFTELDSDEKFNIEKMIGVKY